MGTSASDPNPLLGPDADDNDATVHTATQAIAKWGSMSAFLAHLGYSPGRILYVSPTGEITGARIP